LIDEVVLCEEWAFEQAIALYCMVEKTVAEGPARDRWPAAAASRAFPGAAGAG
jgi:hypothetical protein